MPKVSVIVPVYKVEEYLPACLESVSKQTFQDFELILVDDGSPDTCGAMCDAYAAEHVNTKVLHQQNMGLSEARNQGVKIAAGEYITFIDSDDYVTPDYIEYLLYLCEKYETDVSVARRVIFWDGEEVKFPNQKNTDCMLPVPEALTRICYGSVDICAWGKLYKRHLVERYPYPKGQLYEDTATTYKIVGDANAVAYGTRVVYCWRQRQGSITHAVITERHYFGITAAKEQLAYMERNYPEVVPAAKARCVMKIIETSYRLVMGKMDRELFNRARKDIKPLLGGVLKDRKAGWSLKIRGSALICGYVPYRILSKIYTVAKGSSNTHRI